MRETERTQTHTQPQRCTREERARAGVHCAKEREVNFKITAHNARQTQSSHLKHPSLQPGERTQTHTKVAQRCTLQERARAGGALCKRERGKL